MKYADLENSPLFNKINHPVLGDAYVVPDTYELFWIKPDTDNMLAYFNGNDVRKIRRIFRSSVDGMITIQFLVGNGPESKGYYVREDEDFIVAAYDVTVSWKGTY